LPQFTHTKIDNDASYHAWIARRDAGNALVVAKRKEKEAELKCRKQIKYEQYTITLKQVNNGTPLKSI